MNKKRRAKIKGALKEIERQRDIIDVATDEEQSAYHNLPEPIQWSEKGEIMQEVAEALKNAIETLDEAISDIHDALDKCG